ncbi:MAG: hypothetical protein BGO43_02985 [Gammaproteobacteria bacterium 39-13]|mgnify:CR=1 FL=1|nr:hypothetical protein [Gammaproteobacteria bacterium]OJV85666.1 MAG: hypothetical protein BGO43_02985 [Gammaproteobacteria bacterium 39-13]
MAHIIIMIHDQFSEKMLLRTFQGEQFAHIHIIHIPRETAFNKDFDAQKEILARQMEYAIPANQALNKTQATQWRNQKISLVLFESNYGAPSSPDINEPMLKHLLQEFSNARIVTYSSTIASLGKSLAENDRISAMSKGTVLPQDLAEIFANIPQGTPVDSFAERVLTLPQFRELVKKLNSPQTSPEFRKRSNSTPEATPKENEMTTVPQFSRSHSSFGFTPMFSFAKDAITTTSSTIYLAKEDVTPMEGIEADPNKDKADKDNADAALKKISPSPSTRF